MSQSLFSYPCACLFLLATMFGKLSSRIIPFSTCFKDLKALKYNVKLQFQKDTGNSCFKISDVPEYLRCKSDDALQKSKLRFNPAYIGEKR